MLLAKVLQPFDCLAQLYPIDLVDGRELGDLTGAPRDNDFLAMLGRLEPLTEPVFAPNAPIFFMSNPTSHARVDGHHEIRFK